MTAVMGSKTLIKGEEEKVDQHQRMGSMHPCLFQGVYIQKKETILRNERRDKSVHSPIQSTSYFDVSLHGGIPPRRPPDWKMNKEFSQHGATLIHLASEEALGRASTVQRTFDGFKGEVSNFIMISTLPSPTQLFALKVNDSEIYDDMSMVSKGHSIALEQKNILLYIMNISEYDKRVVTPFFGHLTYYH